MRRGSCGRRNGTAVVFLATIRTASWSGEFRVPAKQSSSLTFGGPDLRDIFVTSAAKSEPMPVMPPGYDPENGYFGGALFHLNAGIQGRLEYRTKLTVTRSVSRLHGADVS